MKRHVAAVMVMGLVSMAVLGARGANGADAVRRTFWEYEKAFFGDLRKIYDFKPTEMMGDPPPKVSGWVEYRFAIDESGWYALWFEDWGSLPLALVVDGEQVFYGNIQGRPRQKVPRGDKGIKAVNLPLEAGEHSLTIKRIGMNGFPGGFPSAWSLTRAQGPEDRVAARIAGHDVVRAGESVTVQVTGGRTPEPVTVDIVVTDLIGKRDTTVASVEFAGASAFETRTVNIPATAEGVFRLQAKLGDDWLLPSEFRAGEFAVIDTQNAPRPGKEQRTLIADVDCVKQTVNGKPIPADRFVECNGATRVDRTPLGAFRVSNDGTGPEVDPISASSKYATQFSGFSYRLSVPDVRATYLIEVDYPDDQWRHMTFPVLDFSDPVSPDAEGVEGSLPAGGGIMCGGIYPLTDSVQTYRSVFWVNYTNLLVSALSQRVGARAAVSRIRVYRFDGPLPPAAASTSGGRDYLAWHEQANDWDYTTNTGEIQKREPQIVADYIGLNRWVAVAAYNGMNGIADSVVSYQNAYYRSREMEGFRPSTYDTARMACLLCEKYGMRYFPHVFLSSQAYFDRVTMDRLTDNSEDLRAHSSEGLEGIRDVQWHSHNALHPAIQQKVIAIVGELADKLRDSPAFAGISSRFSGWLWEGDWALSSIRWGYGDWTVSQFEQDTGVAVPGAADDPGRFAKRFEFLTSNAQRERWLDWRCDRITRFYQGLVDRIRGDRTDLTFAMLGHESVDKYHSETAIGDTVNERFRGMGLDLDKLASLDGFALLPRQSPGRGKVKTELGEQRHQDNLLDPSIWGLSRGNRRGMQFWPQYDEWGRSFPSGKLGMPQRASGKKNFKGWYYVGTTIGAGRYDLQRFALMLANNDANTFFDGSFRINHGNREVRGPWMREYRALPAAEFTPLPFARDPVAVWYADLPPENGDGKSGAFFYCVNREHYPLRIVLDVADAASVTQLGTGETIAIQAGQLDLALDAFQLRAFRAPEGARITGARPVVPPEEIAAVRRRVMAAQQVADAITTGDRAADVDDAQRAAFLANLDNAWSALGEGHLQQARARVSMAPMLDVYEVLGMLPEGQYATQFPDLLENTQAEWHFPDEPFFGAEALRDWVDGPQPEVVQSQTYNSEWRFTSVLSCRDTLELDVPLPCAGDYTLVLGHVGAQPRPLLVSVNGKSVSIPARITQPNVPQHTVFHRMRLQGPSARLRIQTGGDFGVYALKVVPAIRPLDTTAWSTIGPFKSLWTTGRPTPEWVQGSMASNYPPEQAIALDAVYQNAYGKNVRWTQAAEVVGPREGRGPEFTLRCRSWGRDICYAVTYITSPDERDALFLFGTDWWATVWLNGERIATDLPEETQAKFGCTFTTFKPRPVVLKLKPGINTLLVKNMGGHLGSSCSAWMIDRDDVSVSPTPPDQR